MPVRPEHATLDARAVARKALVDDAVIKAGTEAALLWWRDQHGGGAALTMAPEMMGEAPAIIEAVAPLIAAKALRGAASAPLIAHCDKHGYGLAAVIAADCDWCAAFGVDQDWTEHLTAIATRYEEQLPSGEHPSPQDDPLVETEQGVLGQVRTPICTVAQRRLDTVARRSGQQAAVDAGALERLRVAYAAVAAEGPEATGDFAEADLAAAVRALLGPPEEV